MKRRTQERPGGPYKRRDDFFVVIEAGGVFHRDESFGAEGERESIPEPVAGWLAQPVAEWAQCFVDILLAVAASHGLTVPLPAS